MAYEGIYNREYTRDGLKNLLTVIDNSRGGLNKSAWQNWMVSYGFTFIGLVPYTPVSAAAGIASLIFTDEANMVSRFQEQLYQAYKIVANTIIMMGDNGYTKCRIKGAAVFYDSGAYLPYTVQLTGLYKNGVWMTDM